MNKLMDREYQRISFNLFIAARKLTINVFKIETWPKLKEFAC